MGLLKDSILTIGLLVMAATFIIGGIGYGLDLREIRNEAIAWGLTWNDLLFIILALAFWVVVLRLLFRVRKAESTDNSQGLVARLGNLETLVANMASRPGVPAVVSQPTATMPGLLISRAHITTAGSIIHSENILSVGDEGTGKRTITWVQDYANPGYHVSITPTRGTYKIIDKTVGGISIHTYDHGDLPTDIELDILAIGEA